MIGTNRLLNSSNSLLATAVSKIAPSHSVPSPKSPALQEAIKIAFPKNQNPTNAISIKGKDIIPGKYKGYHGTSTDRVFKQFLQGAFEQRSNQRVYVAGEYDLAVSLFYAAQTAQYGKAPQPESDQPLDKVSYPVVLKISSNTPPQTNESLGYLNLATEYESFPSDATVNIHRMILLHPQFPINAVNRDFHKSIYASEETANLDLLKSIQERPDFAELEPLLRQFKLSYPRSY